MTKKRVKEATGHYKLGKIDFDAEGVKYVDNWIRNKTMIDMDSIPKEYKDKILDLWVEPKEGDNSKVFNYMVDKKLGEMIDIVI